MSGKAERIAQLFQTRPIIAVEGMPLDVRKRLPLLDMHNRSVTDPTTNLPPATIHSYLQPGVQYMNQTSSKLNSIGEIEDKQVHFVGFEKVPMGDWDWRDPIHPDNAVSIESLGDVHERLTRYTKDNPDSRWKVYLTPGGIRAWELGRSRTPIKAMQEGMFDESGILKVDPLYGKMTTRKDYSHLYPSKFTPPAFWSRVSQKPTRPNDFVAYYLGNIGEGTINSENARLVNTYHDKVIQDVLSIEGVDPREASLSLLEKQLATVSRSWAAPIEQRLGL